MQAADQTVAASHLLRTLVVSIIVPGRQCVCSHEDAALDLRAQPFSPCYIVRLSDVCGLHKACLFQRACFAGVKVGKQASISLFLRRRYRATLAP